MGGSLLTPSIKVIGRDVLMAKFAVMAPRILARNREMVKAMLEEIKPIVESQTPIGPGHFGYHLRDSYSTEVTSEGLVTKGGLKAPVQGYWREFGTRARYRGPNRVRRYVIAIGGFTGGEKAYMVAHHAASALKRFFAAFFASRPVM